MIFQTIRQQQPLIHCITNYVVANFQANGLLAIGASPVMADDCQEVEEINVLHMHIYWKKRIKQHMYSPSKV